jgi:mannose-6-phosphate isomerase-like protein (cupin superfamily)
MKKVIPVDVSQYSFNINRDLSVSSTRRPPGPPERIDGMTAGIVTMEGNSPHGGEVHPDGDEVLYVISGALSITTDSNPGESLRLGPGDACIIEKGEWHQVHVLEKTQLLHITPGPNGDHRPLDSTK